MNFLISFQENIHKIRNFNLKRKNSVDFNNQSILPYSNSFSNNLPKQTNESQMFMHYNPTSTIISTQFPIVINSQTNKLLKNAESINAESSMNKKEKQREVGK